VAELTVSTFNVHWGGFGPRGRTTYDLGTATAALPGTVRVFQEVWEHPDEPCDLHVPDGWTTVTHTFMAVRRPRDWKMAEPQRSRIGTWSLVVATAHEVLHRETIPLVRVGRDQRTDALHLRLATPVGVLSIVAVHLCSTFVPLGPLVQVTALRRRLPPGPLVVLGDHNLWAGLTGLVLRDLTLAARGPTWEGPRPHHQIDHIWVRGLDVVHGEVLPTAGSDHLPVTATLRG
jgi:endonuclease/exonuclease/phosphatase family metal-dependent hydrolase